MGLKTVLRDGLGARQRKGISELKESGTSATFSCAHEVQSRLYLSSIFGREVEKYLLSFGSLTELNKHFPDGLYLRLPN